jgi:large subunit ribosomal protein L24
MAARIRKGDNVVVIAGRDRGARGEVLRVQDDGRLIVQGVNKVKRHQRPTPRIQQGGIIEKEAPIQASNVMLVDPKSDAPTRVRAGKDKDGRKVRVAVKSGNVLDG